MPVIPLKLKKEIKIREYIKQFLMNIGQNCEDEWWNNLQANDAIARLAGDEQPQVTDSAELCIDCEDALVICSWDGGTDSGALDRLMEEIRRRVESISIAGNNRAGRIFQFLFFTSDLKSRTALEMRLDRNKKRELENAAKKITAMPAVCRFTFVIDREYRGEMARIRDINRYDSILMPSISGRPNTDNKDFPKKKSPCSIVLTVPMRQLVELYNQVGDQLFKRNVRLGISDKMDVQRSMCQTLEKEPENFWYMNNGITLLVEDPDFNLRSADSLELGTLDFDGEPRFSVINGAQTISICSKYVFEWEYHKENSPKRKEEASRRLEDFEKAQVILRVIHVPLRMDQDSSSEEQRNTQLANNISISLNRQKPVKQEDIAFTTPFVQKMLEYLDGQPNAPFRLVRRGENSGYIEQLDLVAFSKARLACIDQPGKARAVSNGEIMKLEFDTDSFRNKDIFVKAWLADDVDRDKVFRSYYGAVLFANQLEDCYKRNQKTVQKKMQEEDCGENSLSALNNGSWYFTALLIQLLNGFSTDYSEFDCTVSAIRDKVPQAMPVFARMAAYCAQTQTLNSNDFKKEELYTSILRKLKTAERASFFQEFAELFAAFVKQGTKSKPGFIQISYGSWFQCENPEPIEYAANAFAATVRDIILQFAPDPVKLEEFSAWLTNDWQQCLSSHNFVKNPPYVVYNGNTYWIGTSINNHSKYLYLDRLCNLAGVPKGEITWTADNKTVYKW